MHEEVLSPKQKDLLPLVASFSDGFGLVGGTAVALQLGHRRSVDFDLATLSRLDAENIRGRLGVIYKINSVLVDETHEYTLVIDGVKFTYMSYPFEIEFEERFNDFIKMPSLISLAAMKAYALGRRAKWKDYVDLYFIINKFSFAEVLNKAKEIFSNEFNEKLFREQLAYFNDINYTETIDYLEGFEVSDTVIREKLTEFSLQRF